MTFKELYAAAKTQLGAISNLENPDFRLEPAEYKKDEGIWETVVSYLVENTNKTSVTAFNLKCATTALC